MKLDILPVNPLEDKFLSHIHGKNKIIKSPTIGNTVTVRRYKSVYTNDLQGYDPR